MPEEEYGRTVPFPLRCVSILLRQANCAAHTACPPATTVLLPSTGHCSAFVVPSLPPWDSELMALVHSALESVVPKTETMLVLLYLVLFVCLFVA